MTDRIAMTTPLVELDGDEMTRVIWAWTKELLIEPFVELKTEYYDLGIEERERTRDSVTGAAAAAIARQGVGVKCATITPNAERVTEYGLSELYPSPNATLRAHLDGTVFRCPILVEGVLPYIPTWTRPITIARHAYGDIYKAVDLLIDKTMAGATVELVATAPSGAEKRLPIHDFVLSDDPSGVVLGMHNTDISIEAFARSCMEYALETRQDLWFATKDTISKIYDRRFRDIFEQVFESDYRQRFEAAAIEYFYTLIDDAVARVIRSEGGFIWACKNYDGDVMSDMVATAFGSLAMMTSVLVSPHGAFEYEAAHGTVQRHYYQHLQGEQTSTNPIATIFAWSGALHKRGELDGIPALSAFAQRLEAASLATIAAGDMTGDLYALSRLKEKRRLSTREFMEAIAARL
ncbi:MAG: NADP-dependent isocitrate dehydrogenase [Coriobacteriales bacterium]|jgi:isocitrate dehydrogenase|nr:NADP-dependent isocitrate dehydrogenase [Coriobacteriales bacterium]